LQSFVEHLSDESEHNAAVAEEEEPIDPIRHVAVEELMRRLFRLHRFADALTLLETHGQQRVAVSQRLSEPRLTEYGIKLAWANHDLQHGQADLAVERLQELLDAPELQAQELEAVRFALSEAYIANNQPDLALKQLEQLVQPEQLKQLPDSAATNWQASVALRRGELLVKLRRSREAIPLLEQAKQAYPDFAQRHEFDYLLARCSIADVDFDRAREHLRNVVDSPSAAGSEAVLRAQWMIGETHLLQRDYSQAVVAYEQVTASAGKSPWRVRAWVQAGKCFELLNQSQRAVESYTAALQAESLEDESLVATRQEARERIEIVQASLSASRDRKRLSNR
jgi:tetratricopeptide (TPR) repeat protein